MTDKNDKKEITTDILMADVMLRVTAMEKLLIEKGLLTQEELAQATEEIAKRVAKVVLEKAQASKTIGELSASIEALNKSKKGLNN